MGTGGEASSEEAGTNRGAGAEAAHPTSVANPNPTVAPAEGAEALPYQPELPARPPTHPGTDALLLEAAQHVAQAQAQGSAVGVIQAQAQVAQAAAAALLGTMGGDQIMNVGGAEPPGSPLHLGSAEASRQNSLLFSPLLVPRSPLLYSWTNSRGQGSLSGGATPDSQQSPSTSAVTADTGTFPPPLALGGNSGANSALYSMASMSPQTLRHLAMQDQLLRGAKDGKGRESDGSGPGSPQVGWGSPWSMVGLHQLTPELQSMSQQGLGSTSYGVDSVGNEQTKHKRKGKDLGHFGMVQPQQGTQWWGGYPPMVPIKIPPPVGVRGAARGGKPPVGPSGSDWDAEEGEEGAGVAQKGHWSRAEDELLTRLVGQMGTQQWANVARNIPGRVGKQCRERYLSHLAPHIKKPRQFPWTDEEKRKIFDLHGRLGNQWQHIAAQLPGRTENATKNYFNSQLRKIAKQTAKKKAARKVQRELAKADAAPSNPQAKRPKETGPVPKS